MHGALPVCLFLFGLNKARFFDFLPRGGLLARASERANDKVGVSKFVSDDKALFLEAAITWLIIWKGGGGSSNLLWDCIPGQFVMPRSMGNCEVQTMRRPPALPWLQM